MATHIIETLSTIQQLDEQPDLEPLFDPYAFVRSNTELTTADYEMNEEELRAWCVRGTEIRRSIDRRVEDLRLKQTDIEEHGTGKQANLKTNNRKKGNLKTSNLKTSNPKPS